MWDTCTGIYWLLATMSVMSFFRTIKFLDVLSIPIKYWPATNIRQGLYQLSHLASCCLANILKQKSTNCIQLIWHENMRMNDFFFISKIIFISLNWYINKNPIKQNQNRYIFENNLVLFSPYFLIKLTVVHISFYPHLLRIYTFQNKAYIQAASVSLFIQLPSILYVWF